MPPLRPAGGRLPLRQRAPPAARKGTRGAGGALKRWRAARGRGYSGREPCQRHLRRQQLRQFSITVRVGELTGHARHVMGDGGTVGLATFDEAQVESDEVVHTELHARLVLSERRKRHLVCILASEPEALAQPTSPAALVACRFERVNSLDHQSQEILRRERPGEVQRFWGRKEAA